GNNDGVGLVGDSTTSAWSALRRRYQPARPVKSHSSTGAERTSGDATAPARSKYRCPSWTLHGHPRKRLCLSGRYERAGDCESHARPCGLPCEPAGRCGIVTENTIQAYHAVQPLWLRGPPRPTGSSPHASPPTRGGVRGPSGDWARIARV